MKRNFICSLLVPGTVILATPTPISAIENTEPPINTLTDNYESGELTNYISSSDYING